MTRKPDRRMLIRSAWTLIDTREVLVQTRTELKRHVNTLVWGIGDQVRRGLDGNLPRYSERFLPEGTRIVAEPTLAAVRSIGWRIADCEHRIEEIVDLYFPETRYVRSYPQMEWSRRVKMFTGEVA
jgi:hypothetical protein